jgi:hypothetical protein
MAAEAEAPELGMASMFLLKPRAPSVISANRYGPNYEELLAEAGELYRHQQERI